SKGTYFSEGRPWFEWHQLPKDTEAVTLTIAFAEIATHNHFVLDRGGKIFNRTAPVVKLPQGSTETSCLGLLAALNSSTACFWIRQNSHDKGNGGYGGGIADQAWERFFVLTATTLDDFPLPSILPQSRGRKLDFLAQKLVAASPGLFGSTQ